MSYRIARPGAIDRGCAKTSVGNSKVGNSHSTKSCPRVRWLTEGKLDLEVGKNLGSLRFTGFSHSLDPKRTLRQQTQASRTGHARLGPKNWGTSVTPQVSPPRRLLTRARGNGGSAVRISLCKLSPSSSAPALVRAIWEMRHGEQHRFHFGYSQLQ
jgi:hypothetical protein